MEVNKALHEWHLIACSKNSYPGGSQLIEKAKEIAKHFGNTDIACSRGWLDKWKTRYNVKMLKYLVNWEGCWGKRWNHG